ncbi:GIY-YIG nuclease family protein [Halorhabdus salina]|uniref:GIY-YIG nuclease family protein n=1 Tax=Halorhabdus salina TaxID=2750670 RepID=UPI0015EE518F|nr:GIY-YIG nuclease family protein [Halorhabdus salina]
MTDGEGTYTLVIALETDATITFGAAGERALDPGGYAYTGSAFGAGGFSRIDRHRELAAGERDTRHWHVDYLLGYDATRIADIVKTPDADVECPVARTLADECEPIEGIGASDCDCNTHLVYAPEVEDLRQVVEHAHEAARQA